MVQRRGARFVKYNCHQPTVFYHSLISLDKHQHTTSRYHNVQQAIGAIFLTRTIKEWNSLPLGFVLAGSVD
ncbi:hypothetical protein MAR_026888, partial [Mya arenaria]